MKALNYDSKDVRARKSVSCLFQQQENLRKWVMRKCNNETLSNEMKNPTNERRKPTTFHSDSRVFILPASIENFECSRSGGLKFF